MAAHTQAVRRGAPDTSCIVSMPRSMLRGSHATRDVALLDRTSIPRERDQSPADERSEPADRREDGVADQAGARGVLEQEPVGPTQSERGQDPRRR